MDRRAGRGEDRADRLADGRTATTGADRSTAGAHNRNEEPQGRGALARERICAFSFSSSSSCIRFDRNGAEVALIRTPSRRRQPLRPGSAAERIVGGRPLRRRRRAEREDTQPSAGEDRADRLADGRARRRRAQPLPSCHPRHAAERVGGGRPLRPASAAERAGVAARLIHARTPRDPAPFAGKDRGPEEPSGGSSPGMPIAGAETPLESRRRSFGHTCRLERRRGLSARLCALEMHLPHLSAFLLPHPSALRFS